METVVLKLTRYQRIDLLRHFQALSPDDIRLRFGRPMSKEAIEEYVDGINFSDHKVLGIYCDDHALAGVAHLELNPECPIAKLGLSVVPDQRRKGYGQLLLRTAVSLAAALGVRTLYMHCLPENDAMMHLARKAGFLVTRIKDQAVIVAGLDVRPERCVAGAD